jgi:aminopeptidase S
MAHLMIEIMTKKYLPCLLFLFTGFLHSGENSMPDSLRELASLKQHTNQARLEALLKILQERAIAYELETFESKASQHGRIKGANVVITVGSGPKDIAVGAHYDALEFFQGGMSDGMIDNGASAITLVRMAEALKARSLHHRMRIILFDLEEIGMVGSKVFVAAHKSNIAAAINVDVGGFGDSFIYGFGTATGTDQLRKIFRAVCNEQLLTCVDSAAFPPSDDRSFEDAGIPVISVAMLPRLMMYQTWLSINGGNDSGLERGFVPRVFKIMHTPEDNISKIEPAAMDLEFQVLLDTVLKLDAALK